MILSPASLESTEVAEKKILGELCGLRELCERIKENWFYAA